MTRKYLDNASFSLAQPLAMADLTATLQAGQGAVLAALVAAAGDNTVAVVTQATPNAGDVETSWERVSVTLPITGDVVTVARGQENSTAAVWPAGSKFEIRQTAQGIMVPAALAASANTAASTANTTATAALANAASAQTTSNTAIANAASAYTAALAAQATANAALGKTSVFMPPSGDTTGATDAANFASVYLAGNFIMLTPGGAYFLNSPVTAVSHSLLQANGATITLVTGQAGNVIRTKSSIADRTGDLTARAANGNATISSLTANFTSTDIGATVSGAGAGAFTATYAASLYGKITAVGSPTSVAGWVASTSYGNTTIIRPSTANGMVYQAGNNGASGTTQPTWPTTFGATVTDGNITWTCLGASTTATLSVSVVTSVTSSTLEIFYAASRCTDITVRGGMWVITDALVNGHTATATFRNSFASAWRRCDGLRLDGMSWNATPGTGTGGRFTVSVADCNNVTITDINFVRTGGDGVHVTGPASNVFVSNIRGSTNDDMTVCNCQDGYTPYITDTEGSLLNITFRDVYPTASGSAGFRLYEGGVVGRWTVFNLRVEHYSGVTAASAMIVLDAGNADNITVKDISGYSTNAGIPLVSVNMQKAAGIVYEDINYTGSLPMTLGVMYFNAPRGTVNIKNLRFSSQTAVANAGTNYGVYITGGNINGGGYSVTDIVIDGFYTGWDVGSLNSSSPANCTLVYFAAGTTSGSTTTNSNLTLRNIHGLGTTGYILNKLANGNVGNIHLSDSTWLGDALFNLPSGVMTGAPAPIIRMSNVKATVTNMINSIGPLTLEMVNTDINSTGAMVNLTTATATPVIIKQTNCAQLGAGALVARDGSQAIRVRGIDIPVDQTLLTPADGDMIYNNNATPLNGTGIAIYNTAAAKWKNVYSGTTN